jgi:polyhydroxyalkanoate synthesis regulator phasin
MRLSRALQEKLMDVRLRDKLIAEGKVTKEEVKKYLDNIPDEMKNATFTDENALDEDEE